MYYVYILKSESTGKYYIGQTQNLEERIIRHNTGQSKYTKGKGPWKLVYKKECQNRSEVLALEKKLNRYVFPPIHNKQRNKGLQTSGYVIRIILL